MIVAELIDILKKLPPETRLTTLEKSSVYQDNIEHIFLEDMHNIAVIKTTELGKVWVSRMGGIKDQGRIPVTPDQIRHYIRFLQDVLAELEEVTQDAIQRSNSPNAL